MLVVGFVYVVLLEFICFDVVRLYYFVNYDFFLVVIVFLSVFWQLFILVIMGIVIFFVYVGLFEFFYYELFVCMCSLGIVFFMFFIVGGFFQNGGFMVGVNVFMKKFVGKGWFEFFNFNFNYFNY